jgi:hypothetical protein
MKLARLALGLVASTLALTSAQPAPSNASALPIAVSSNTSHGGIDLQTYCTLPRESPLVWYYNSLSDGPYGCLGEPRHNWAMLNSYRSGGNEWVHWKYTENAGDFDCLKDWTWHAEDGKREIARIKGRLAVDSDGRHWCGMNVYRSGGVEQKQWTWCNCYQ